MECFVSVNPGPRIAQQPTTTTLEDGRKTRTFPGQSFLWITPKIISD